MHKTNIIILFKGDTIADEKDPVSAHQGGSDSMRACIWIIMLGAAAVLA